MKKIKWFSASKEGYDSNEEAESKIISYVEQNDVDISDYWIKKVYRPITKGKHA